MAVTLQSLLYWQIFLGLLILGNCRLRLSVGGANFFGAGFRTTSGRVLLCFFAIYLKPFKKSIYI